MNDREMLELAAKAVGMRIVGDVDSMIVQPGRLAGGLVFRNDRGGDSLWNPLTDDGDALRLAVKLGIEVTPFLSGSCAVTTPTGWKRTESGYENGLAAARRAITRAAAEIGKGIP